MHSSLELSKELYEKSGWDDTDFMYGKKGIAPRTVLFGSKPTPAYDLGYLLQKLPKENAQCQYLQLRFEDEDYCYAGYYDKRGNADLPTEAGPIRAVDAVAQLCINLINQGILPVEEMK